MGQRLVVTIKNNCVDLAKIYYHWSAYTVSALCEARKLVECIYNNEDESEKDFKLRLIRFCEENGGGIRGDDYEFEYIEKMYPNEKFKKEDYSRSNGLIAISEKGMNEIQNCSEGDLIINVSEDEVNNGVFGYWDSLEEYNDEIKSWGEEYEDEVLSIENVPDIGYDLGCISIDDIGDVIAALAETNEHIVRYGNEIYELVE